MIKNHILISKFICNQIIRVSSDNFPHETDLIPGEGLDDEDEDYEDEEEGDDDDDDEDEEEENSPPNAPSGGKQGDDPNECKQQ